MGKKKGSNFKKKKSRWQRRIEKRIVEWWQDLAKFEEMRKGTVLGRKVMGRLNRGHEVVKKGMVAVSFLLKRKIQFGSMRG